MKRSCSVRVRLSLEQLQVLYRGLAERLIGNKSVLEENLDALLRPHAHGVTSTANHGLLHRLRLNSGEVGALCLRRLRTSVDLLDWRQRALSTLLGSRKNAAGFEEALIFLQSVFKSLSLDGRLLLNSVVFILFEHSR